MKLAVFAFSFLVFFLGGGREAGEGVSELSD